MKKVVKFILWLLLAVAILVGILTLFAKQWVLAYMSPSAVFELQDAPPAPNYSEPYFWVAHPDKQDTSDLIPPGIKQDDDLSGVNVFFVHSTGYVGPGGWNSNMKDENSEAQSIEYMLSSMASIFNGCCQVYAPHYREASLMSFGPENMPNGTQALDLAYQDVEQAFEYFLENLNNDQPFMIVSHSQGTTHAMRLLENKVDNTPLEAKLVAAYLLGYWFPMDKFERGFSSITPCEQPEQTGCIVSYDAYGEGGEKTNTSPHWYNTGWESSEGKTSLCVNPLSWTRDLQRAPQALHLGGMQVEFKRQPLDMLLARNPGFKFSELPEISEPFTWAQCQVDGRLELAEQHDNTFSNHLDSPDKSYHVLVFSLFYANIRQNAKLRTRAYLNASSSDK
jgi:hypothetical protein